MHRLCRLYISIANILLRCPWPNVVVSRIMSQCAVCVSHEDYMCTMLVQRISCMGWLQLGRVLLLKLDRPKLCSHSSDMNTRRGTPSSLLQVQSHDLDAHAIIHTWASWMKSAVRRRDATITIPTPPRNRRPLALNTTNFTVLFSFPIMLD